MLYAAIWTGMGLFTLVLHSAALRVGGTLPLAALLQPILFALTIWPVMTRYLRRREWATIANGILLLIYLYFGVGCAFYTLAYDTIDLPPSLRAPEFGAQVMAAAILAAVCYRFGAEGPWFKRASRLLPRLPRTPRWSTPIRVGVIAAITVAMLIKLYMMQIGNFGYRLGDQPAANGVYNILTYVASFGMVGLVIGLYYWFTGTPLRTWDKGLIISLFGLQLISALVSGMKESALELLIFAAIPYVVTGHRLKIRFVLPTLILVAALFALNPYYRVALAYVGTGGNRVDAASDAMDLMVSGRLGQRTSFLNDGSLQFIHRISLFPYMLPVVEKTPSQYGYRDWGRYPYLLPTAVVPRVFWPDKPIQDQAGDFNRTYITNNGNATTPTTIGWAYLEDGFLGVAILMTLLGATARFLHMYTLRRHGTTLAAVVVFTVSFRFLFQLEGDPYWIFNGLIKQLLATSFAYWAIIYLPQIVLSRRLTKRSSALVGPLHE